MRTSYLFSLLLVALSFSAIAQNDWKKLELKGKVKSLEVINYLAVEKFGEVKKTRISSGEKYTFSQNGLITHKMIYGQGGKPIEQTGYKYDDYNNIIEENLSDKDGILKRRTLSEYNSFNRRTYESVYNFEGNLLSRSIYSYKNDIQPAKILTFNARGKEVLQQEYSYNKKNMSKIKKTINPSSNMIEQVQKFDKNDHLIESYVFDIEGNVERKFIYILDDNYNVIETKYFEGDVLKVHRTLTYNHLNFLVDVNVQYLENNKSDNLTYTYDFDEKSNWIKKTEYVNSIPVKVKERTIIYY